MYKISGRRARWKGRVLDRSLSSGLCHGRCACMAGQKKYLNKKITIFGSEGRQHGVYFCPGSPLRCVVCALSVLSYCFVSYFCSPPIANSRTWILDNCGRIEISSPKMILGRFDAGRLLLDEPE